jgi:alanyl-tRNA synthetase
MANSDVVKNEPVETIQTSKVEAEAMGAMMFFGDKYGDKVRVVRAGEHSLEFCGGTHVERLGDIGQIQIVSEVSIGANTRRIEAVTGLGALERSQEMEKTLSAVATLLKSSMEEVVPSLERMFDRQKLIDREISALRQAQLSAFAEELDARSTGDVVAARVDGFSGDKLRVLSQDLQRRGRRVVVVAGADGEKVAVAVATDGSVDASAVVKQLATLIGGGGGGSRELALAGGKNPDGIGALLQAAQAL